MKTSVLTCLAISVGFAALPLITFARPPANEVGRRSGGEKEAEKDADPTKKPPFNGMTKSQARQRYGEPHSVSSTSQGETWTYRLNMGEVVGKSLIPFYFGKNNIRIGVLMFNNSGKVIQYNWATE